MAPRKPVQDPLDLKRDALAQAMIAAGKGSESLTRDISRLPESQLDYLYAHYTAPRYVY